MNLWFSPLSTGLARFVRVLVALACCRASPASTEKADRLQAAERRSRPAGKIDLLKQLVVFNGNVVVTKGR
jgi:lipopolysaccharide export system protein LptA